MTEHICVRTSCLLQSIREDREPAVVERAVWQVPLLIGGLDESNHHSIVPG